MGTRRRDRGFETLGAPGARGLSLPPHRARELVLADAWRRAAGRVLADRARAVRVERGTLEVEVPERRWAEALAAQLLELASRTAALAPELAIRKLRVRLPGGVEAMPVTRLDPDRESRGAAGRPERVASRRQVRASRGDPAPVEATSLSLIELRDRYLARSAKARGGTVRRSRT
ncbi:MAG: DciA family protein [Acidobacteriia bacterium]|nr:DciA family protein [Terriglobia bacterium]